MDEKNPGIIYFYDALCGWCYGFSPVMTALYRQHPDWKFEVISGGMMMGERMGPVDVVAPFLKKGAHKAVEERTGIKFGEGFFKNIVEPGTAILSSLEPAIAMSVFKSFRTGKEVLFAAALQRAINYDGVETNKLESYIPYVDEFGISRHEFAIRLKDPAYHDQAYQDFGIAGKFGIQGFPTTVMLYGDKYYLLSNGYTTLEVMEERIRQIIVPETT